MCAFFLVHFRLAAQIFHKLIFGITRANANDISLYVIIYKLLPTIFLHIPENGKIDAKFL